MSYKTDRLVELFPDAFAAADPGSLLHTLLDALGAEFLDADDSLKQLLKSHWVNYASGAALDGLASIFGVTRRRLRDDLTMESDEAFRLRLKAVVQLFTGGGTVRAVKGAVRSALGLPFDLDQLNLPARFQPLRDAIEALVTLEEFSPTVERLTETVVTAVNGASELVLVVDLPTVEEERPTIAWSFQDSGRRLSLELNSSGQGVKATDDLFIRPGDTLFLSAESDGQLIARLNGENVTNRFTRLDGTSPPLLPAVPLTRSEWKFRAQSGLYSLSAFDTGETFDLPRFRVEMTWPRFQPLTFNVFVPYFLEATVRQLADLHGFTGKLLVFEGLPPERIQEVVNQTKAAGVRGSVHFTLNVFERQQQADQVRIDGTFVHSDAAEMADALTIGSVDRTQEVHHTSDRVMLGGVFDVSTFDGSFGFVA
jgi:hypothetical protein